MAKFPVAALETNCASEECAGSANGSGESESKNTKRPLHPFHLHLLLANKTSSFRLQAESGARRTPCPTARSGPHLAQRSLPSCRSTLIVSHFAFYLSSSSLVRLPHGRRGWCGDLCGNNRYDGKGCAVTRRFLSKIRGHSMRPKFWSFSLSGVIQLCGTEKGGSAVLVPI